MRNRDCSHDHLWWRTCLGNIQPPPFKNPCLTLDTSCISELLERSRPTFQAGAFLCAEEGVDIQTRIQGATQGLFAGNGFFLMRCSGRGSVAFNCTGSCIKYDLQPGECRVVDNGHLVAWADTVSYTVTRL